MLINTVLFCQFYSVKFLQSTEEFTGNKDVYIITPCSSYLYLMEVEKETSEAQTELCEVSLRSVGRAGMYPCERSCCPYLIFIACKDRHNKLHPQRFCTYYLSVAL